MSDSTEIIYRGFCYVPEMFITRHRGLQLLFDRPFDEELDDYPSFYRVYVMPNIPEERLAKPASWVDLPQMAVFFMGDVPISEIVFDATKRRWIETGVLDRLAESIGATP